VLLHVQDLAPIRRSCHQSAYDALLTVESSPSNNPHSASLDERRSPSPDEPLLTNAFCSAQRKCGIEVSTVCVSPLTAPARTFVITGLVTVN